MIKYSRFVKIFVFCFCVFFIFILLITAIVGNWNMFLYDLVKYLILGIGVSLYVATLSEIFLSINDGIDNSYNNVMKKIHNMYKNNK